jgi:drug/metabolite transporter (DMT)-like permease
MAMTRTKSQSPVAAPERDRAWPVAFVALAAIWGTSFLFIKVAVGSVSPVYVALGRTSIGMVTLMVLLPFLRAGLPRGWPVWGHLAVAALLFNTVPFFLIALGEEHVSSVLAGIWNATTPLVTVPAVAAIVPGERPTRQKVLGVLIGFAGVVVVLGPWRHTGGAALLGTLACLGGATSYGLAFAYTRRFLSGRTESGVSLSAAQLLLGTVQLAVLAPLVAPMPHTPGWRAAGSLLVLGALGTGIAYILNYRVLRAAGPTTASTVTYLIPVFSTVAGVVFLHEELTWNEPVGGLVVLAGVALAQGLLTAKAAAR